MSNSYLLPPGYSVVPPLEKQQLGTNIVLLPLRFEVLEAVTKRIVNGFGDTLLNFRVVARVVSVETGEPTTVNFHHNVYVPNGLTEDQEEHWKVGELRSMLMRMFEHELSECLRTADGQPHDDPHPELRGR